MNKNKIRPRDRPLEILARLWAKWGADVLLVGGAISLTYGAAEIYPPAGAIIGGLLAMFGAWLAASGSGGDGT